MRIVRQSVSESLPISKHTAIIMATEATFTASRNIENIVEFLIILTIGLSRATKTKEGKKMAIVDTAAP